jgi:hypothetical protein
MALGTSFSNRTSEIPNLAWDLTLHRVLCASIAVLGTIINFTAIIVIIWQRLYQQKTFIFVLKFFGGNLLMSSVALPLLLWFSFSSLQNTDTRCLISGYTQFGITVNVLMDLSLISVNRYVQIIHFHHYEKVFSTRNTRLILTFAWLFYPTALLFPLTGLWGNFTLDSLRLICSPIINNEGFWLFTVGFTMLVTAPIPVCYIGIIRKAISSGNRVDATQGGNKQRIKNERQLILSILILITSSCVMHIPLVVSFQADPKIELISPWFHCLSYYLASSICLVNGLTECVLNQQIKTPILKVMKQVCK